MTDGQLFHDLRRYSARWGADLGLTQGAGGNTSVKVGSLLHVKGSGERLADAEKKDIFVALDLAQARIMAEGEAAVTLPDGRRSSIETGLHAVTPHRVVAHLHMVEALAFAVREDAPAALAAALDGEAWAWIAYVKPGAGLASAIAARMAEGPVDILVLGNHGILVGGDSFEAVQATLDCVRRRLSAPVRAAPADTARLAQLGARLGLTPARLPEAHLAATDATSLAFATAGTLYPDHVVFLGRGAARLDPAADRLEPSPSKLHLAAGIGALLPRDAPLAAHEMAACLGLTVSRIAPGASLRTLTAAAEDELLNWNAEAYRQQRAT